MARFSAPGAGLGCLLVALGLIGRAPAASADGPGAGVVRVVALGDSITRGVRPGVRSDETFASLAERALRADGIDAEVVNLGVGGERTDQALKRLDAVGELRPRVVTVMYGTNDSYVDRGSSASRISREEYKANLRAIVAGLLLRGIEPILMTEPRWADDAPANGLGEDPNLAARPVHGGVPRGRRRVPRPAGGPFRPLDRSPGGRPGPGRLDDRRLPSQSPGHRALAEALRSVLREAFGPAPRPVRFTTTLRTALEHDDGQFLWYHPRATAIPPAAGDAGPEVLITLQKHLRTSDHYSGLSVLPPPDLGRTWAGPRSVAELAWVRERGGVDVAVADVTPMFLPRSGKVLAVGAQVRYSPEGEQLEDRPRSHQTAYAVFDPKAGRWTPWRRVEMPADGSFNFACSACAQFVVEADGSVLLPFYVAKSAEVPYRVTIARCAFDGDALAYREHGDVLALDVARALRAVARPPRRSLLPDDPQRPQGVRHRGRRRPALPPHEALDVRRRRGPGELQHAAILADPRTRPLPRLHAPRSGQRPHPTPPRHRAPLLIAQVDPERLRVIRATERVLVLDSGAELGSFGASAITDRESWATVAEGVWDDGARRRGAKGAVFAARVLWEEPAPGPD